VLAELIADSIFSKGLDHSIEHLALAGTRAATPTQRESNPSTQGDPLAKCAIRRRNPGSIAQHKKMACQLSLASH
jgi:hypothetical protein